MLRKGCSIGLPLLLALMLLLSSTALAVRPSAPQLVISIAFIQEDRVVIVWSDPEIGDPILDYQISLNGEDWISIGLVNEYTLSGLGVYDNQVELYIRAVNSDGPGEYKAFLTATVADPWREPPGIIGPGYVVPDLAGYKVLTAPLEVRAGSGTEFEVIDTLPAGAILKWINWDDSGNWWRLEYNDGQNAGWVLRTSVKWKNAAYPEIQ